jgi:hypothetical protein
MSPGPETNLPFVKGERPGELSRLGRSPCRGAVTRGQELLEFALIVPLLLIFVIAAIDLGRVFYVSILVANAAREGARYAISYGIRWDSTPPGQLVIVSGGQPIRDAVIQEAQGSGITITNGEIQINCLPSPPGNCVGGNPMRVTVTHAFDTITSSIAGWAGMNITRDAEMMIPFRGT